MISDIIMIADNKNLPIYVIATQDDGFLIVDEYQLYAITNANTDIIMFADIDLVIDRRRLDCVTGFAP